MPTYTDIQICRYTDPYRAYIKEGFDGLKIAIPVNIDYTLGAHFRGKKGEGSEKMKHYSA
jgi:hypothetical protein